MSARCAPAAPAGDVLGWLQSSRPAFALALTLAAALVGAAVARALSDSLAHLTRQT